MPRRRAARGAGAPVGTPANNNGALAVTKPKRRLASEKYRNNTSRLRKWVCDCTDHEVDHDTGRRMRGPCVIRVAGDALLAECIICKTMFHPVDEPAKRRLYRGCQHCENPEAHEHGALEDASADAEQELSELVIVIGGMVLADVKRHEHRSGATHEHGVRDIAAHLNIEHEPLLTGWVRHPHRADQPCSPNEKLLEPS